MKKLFLIGYRGTGKTTLGKKIAKELNYTFLDLDSEIVKKTKKTIPQIFETEKEIGFREYEHNALIDSIKKENVIVSCGGGIITRKDNIKLLKENGIVCLLTANPKTIYDRIYLDKTRPKLTNNKNLMQEIVLMLNKRNAAYQKTKDFEISTENKTQMQCVEEILEKFNFLKD